MQESEGPIGMRDVFSGECAYIFYMPSLSEWIHQSSSKKDRELKRTHTSITSMKTMDEYRKASVGGG